VVEFKVKRAICIEDFMGVEMEFQVGLVVFGDCEYIFEPN
jgi:hypothetical protein